ncbi:LPXTG cell wall anchor domain-containing protein [Hymenobacter fodinae]|uniref:LPXTG cell wall anchor domain-containing protein n=1 Tax=Hymenobacter fodinae TaxID=2510796 RepID=A0A4Z0PBL7_9BACT|nr:LPXTG cell wall anchor domain-containing protein [Hymenobacter fodinae]TGE09643.1 LPXTG cell wall anchor domain-containing protein [Hymenobacter fodinae]
MPYRRALLRPAHPTRDYMPLVLAVLTAALGTLLLVGAAAGSSSSFIPLIGILLLVLGGVIFYYWRYE